MLNDFFKFIVAKDIHLVLIYILLGYIIYQLIKGLISRNTKRLKKKRQKTMQKLVENIVKLSYLLFSMGFLPKKANRLPKVLK